MAQQTTEERKTVLNGVDVDAVAGLIDAVKEKPDLAESKFRISQRMDRWWAQSYYHHWFLRCWPGDFTYPTFCTGCRRTPRSGGTR